VNQVSTKSFGALMRMPLGWGRSLSAAAVRSAWAASTRLRKPRHNIPEGKRPHAVIHGDTLLRAGILAGVACFVAFVQAAPIRAQQHKSKIPIVGKITAGSNRQAYSGTIQSVDLKQKVLSVNSRQGRDTVIFPLRKDIHVEAVNGKKMKLKALTRGMSVLIYYEEKGGGRLVKSIIVLESGKRESQHTPTS
jgi:hypothetical protein